MKISDKHGGKGDCYSCPVRPDFSHHAAALGKAVFGCSSLAAARSTSYQPDSCRLHDRLAARKNELAIVHQTGERDYNAVAYGIRPARIKRGGVLSYEHGGTLCLGGHYCLPAGLITAAEIAA